MKKKINNIKKEWQLLKCRFSSERKQLVFSTRKGFTLVETLIAVFLFSLVSVMVSGIFGNFLKNYAESKKMQQNIEATQFAMNLMAKTIRTSDVRKIDENNLGCFDYAQLKCIKYSLVSNKLQVYTSDGDALDNCNFDVMTSPDDLTPPNVTKVFFNVVPSTIATYGVVAVAVTVKNDSQTSSPLKIQTAVSLRNSK